MWQLIGRDHIECGANQWTDGQRHWHRNDRSTFRRGSHQTCRRTLYTLFHRHKFWFFFFSSSFLFRVLCVVNYTVRFVLLIFCRSIFVCMLVCMCVCMWRARVGNKLIFVFKFARASVIFSLSSSFFSVFNYIRYRFRSISILKFYCKIWFSSSIFNFFSFLFLCIFIVRLTFIHSLYVWRTPKISRQFFFSLPSPYAVVLYTLRCGVFWKPICQELISIAYVSIYLCFHLFPFPLDGHSNDTIHRTQLFTINRVYYFFFCFILSRILSNKCYHVKLCVNIDLMNSKCTFWFPAKMK